EVFRPIRAQATAASQPACPAPTMTMSNRSVNCICSNYFTGSGWKTLSPQRHGDTEKSLRALGSVGEDGFLPFIRREIPIAGTGFVIVAAGPVGGREIAPIVHPNLEEGAARNFGADFYRAAISA